MGLLRVDGDGWLGDRGLRHLPAGSQRGKETLERKLAPRMRERVYRIFARWGFGAVALAALLPPPTPLIAFVLTAGAMQYSMKKFLFALTLGRIVRYSILAFLAARYGRKAFTVISQH